MQINNPLQINDWEIKRFLKVVLTLQLALWCMIGLDAAGLQIPILRQLIGFIYLTFIPGILIIRVLKLHKLGNIETLLYSVGLSIALLMFTGLFINTVYPIVGISGPISLAPLIITISAVVLVLCILSYVRDRDFSDPSFIDAGGILSPPALFLCLIPFLAVFGTYLMNLHQNNILLMLLIIVIALIGFLIAFERFIPKNVYPLAVIVIALSLLFHRTLISLYLTGWDIFVECDMHKLVEMNSYWSSVAPATNTNAMLSVTILPTIYSGILNMEGMWIFKIIWPIIFSLVPLGLYQAYQKQTNQKIAFLSVFFFMSVMTFYTEMNQLAKQQIAELFFVLLMLLMINRDLNLSKGRALFIFFSAAMIVSHYGLSDIYMLSAVLVLVILYVMNAKSKIFTNGSVLIFVTLLLSWYMYTASSAPFDTIVRIGDNIYNSIYVDFFNPEARHATRMLLGETPGLWHEVTKNIHIITQFFITIGIIKLVLKHKKMGFYDEYIAFSIIYFGILVACAVVPRFSDSLNINRMYHVSLLFLAPFCILGGEAFFQLILKVLNYIFAGFTKNWQTLTDKSSLKSLSFVDAPYKFLSIFMIMFFLFNIGFVYEVVKDPHPVSIALNSTTDYPCYSEGEVCSATWLLDSTENISTGYYGRAAYCDRFYSPDSYRYQNTSMQIVPFVEKGDTGQIGNPISNDSYIYLRSKNIRDRLILLYPKIHGDVKYVDLHNLTFYNTLLNSNRVYQSGGCEIYCTGESYPP